MLKRLILFKNRHPFFTILMIGLFFRLIAAIFSKGFGMHDDYFLVIEPGGSWSDGVDYVKWLPWTLGNEGPQGHSFFYVGINYAIFSFLKLFGMGNPQTLMFFNRLIHAAISLLIISFGYRIASLISNKKTAYFIALLLSVFWFMPFLSVRNLVEIVCIPFLMYSTLIVLRQEIIRKNKEQGFHRTSYLIAGFFFGLAFSVRFQTIFYIGGIGLALLFAKNWKGMLLTAAGVLVSIILVQGGIDFLVWGRPFAELTEYVTYNVEHATSYITKPWYNYLLVIGGLLIPPISLMMLFGFFRDWKKQFLLFFPTFIFLVFHSAFPNKQERFILPIIPMIIILGMVGWDRFIKESNFWKNHQKILKACWIFFWIINISALIAVTPTYSKKARVESMAYLRNYPQTKYFVIEDIDRTALKRPPVFYSGHNWPKYNAIMKTGSDWKGEKASELPPYKTEGKKLTFNEFKEYRNWQDISQQPAFVFFHNAESATIENRVDSMMTIFPNLVFETTIKPSFMDLFIHRINPHNANESIDIYRNQDVIPKKFKKK